MTELHWGEISKGILTAFGDDWTYLITSDDRMMVLTRFSSEVPVSVAAEAALYAIQLGGVYAGSPGSGKAAEEVIRHLKITAQSYESGLDGTGLRAAWQHGFKVL